MIKRMVIMLVAVAVVFGGIFGFQAFKAVMIKKFITALSNPPQTVSAATAGTSEWQSKIEAIGSLRAVRGADLSLEVSGVVESISFQFRGRCPGGRDVTQAAHCRRRRPARIAEGHGRVERDHLRSRPKLLKTQAVSQAQLDSDAANLKNAKAQVAQQQGDRRQEDLARAVRRPARHSRRRSRAVSRRRHADRDAAGARPDLCRLLPAAAGGRSGPARPDRSR